jgi:hypothetical protein
MSTSATPSIDSFEFIGCEFYRAEFREGAHHTQLPRNDSIGGVPEKKLRIRLWSYAAEEGFSAGATWFGCRRRGFLDLDPDRVVRIGENTYRTITNELQRYALDVRGT